MSDFYTNVHNNATVAAQFLKLLDPEAAAHAFRTFSDRRESSSRVLARKFYGPFDQCAAALIRFNEKGAGVFVVINETDGQDCKTENIIKVRAVFVDLDGAPLQPVQAARLKPHIIVESSPGKWHAYWRVTGMALDAFKPVQERLISAFDGDKQVTALAGVMRLPGFYHHKTDKPFLVRIVEAHDTPPYPAPYFRVAKRPKRRSVDDEIEINIDKVIAALDAATNNDVDEDTWFRLMASAWRGSAGDEAAYQAFSRWSAQSAKHRENRTWQRWRSFSRRPPCDIGPGTLYAHANETAPGWREAMVAEAMASLVEQYRADVVAASIAKTKGGDNGSHA
jgi:hypothetical protein